MNKIFALFVATLLVANTLAIDNCLVETTEPKCYLCKSGFKPIATTMLTCEANAIAGCVVPAFQVYAGLNICELCEASKFPTKTGTCVAKAGSLTTSLDTSCGLYTITSGGTAWNCAGCTGTGKTAIDSTAGTTGACSATAVTAASTGTTIVTDITGGVSCPIGVKIDIQDNTKCAAHSTGAANTDGANAQAWDSDASVATTANKYYWASDKTVVASTGGVITEVAGCWLSHDGVKCGKCRQNAMLKTTVKKLTATPWYEVACATYTKPTVANVTACAFEYTLDAGVTTLCHTCVDMAGVFTAANATNMCTGAAAAGGAGGAGGASNSSILSLTFAALLMLIINRLF